MSPPSYTSTLSSLDRYTSHLDTQSLRRDFLDVFKCRSEFLSPLHIVVRTNVSVSSFVCRQHFPRRHQDGYSSICHDDCLYLSVIGDSTPAPCYRVRGHKDLGDLRWAAMLLSDPTTRPTEFVGPKNDEYTDVFSPWTHPPLHSITGPILQNRLCHSRVWRVQLPSVQALLRRCQQIFRTCRLVLRREPPRLPRHCTISNHGHLSNLAPEEALAAKSSWLCKRGRVHHRPCPEIFCQCGSIRPRNDA